MKHGLAMTSRFAGFFLVLCSTLGTQAFASCLKRPDWTSKPFSMDTGPVVLKNDVQVGQTFFTKKFDIAVDGTVVVKCIGAGGIKYNVVYGQPIAGYQDVYSTNLDGIGYRLKYNFGGSGHDARALPYSTNFDSDANVRLGNPQTFIIELVKTAETTKGGSIGGGAIMAMVDDLGNKIMDAYITTGLSKITFPSCTVKISNIPVALGKVTVNQFSGVNSVAGKKDFPIGLKCRAGENISKNIYIRIDGVKDPLANQESVLQITSGTASPAKGVGIQILDGTKAPIRLGSRMAVGPSKNGDYDLLFTAGYFQTASKVTPGVANGIATFTIEYD